LRIDSMAEIIGVRFKEAGKVYYFAPEANQFAAGDYVVVETARGMECGEVAIANKNVPDESLTNPLKPVIRRATEEDLRQLKKIREKEAAALETCAKKVQEHQLDMKLVDVEYTFDGSKIVFYFTAEGRVDFRELVKDLASVFRTRIELRQIGVRDEAKMLGGIGICGRPFCCSDFLDEFQPVSIKMAKEQGLSLNPVKISGTCGRLMCCLKYEQDAYESLIKITPKVGATVNTPEGKGVVVEANLLTGVMKVRLDSRPDAAPAVFQRSDLTGTRMPAPRPEPQESKEQKKQEEPKKTEQPKAEQPKPVDAVSEEKKDSSPNKERSRGGRDRRRHHRPNRSGNQGEKKN